MQKIGVLGTEYTIHFRDKSEDLKLIDSDGYCDETTKDIVVETFKMEMGDVQACVDLQKIQRQVVRHELVHAFLFESGLGACSEWAQNEEMVDWIARQFPKMAKAFQELNILE